MAKNGVKSVYIPDEAMRQPYSEDDDDDNDDQFFADGDGDDASSATSEEAIEVIQSLKHGGTITNGIPYDPASTTAYAADDYPSPPMYGTQVNNGANPTNGYPNPTNGYPNPTNGYSNPTNGYPTNGSSPAMYNDDDDPSPQQVNGAAVYGVYDDNSLPPPQVPGVNSGYNNQGQKYIEDEVLPQGRAFTTVPGEDDGVPAYPAANEDNEDPADNVDPAYPAANEDNEDPADNVDTAYAAANVDPAYTAANGDPADPATNGDPALNAHGGSARAAKLYSSSSSGSGSDSDDEDSDGSTIVLSKTSLYYVLSKIFMTETGLNMADLLSDVCKELKTISARLSALERAAKKK
jgi:hypothetical protein